MQQKTSKARPVNARHSGTASGTQRERRPLLTPKRASRTSFPIVGIGASAGGLEAFKQLLAYLPSDSGMAFVFIQHLSPTHPSLLREAVAHATQMEVLRAEDGMRVEPNHVYVIPPGEDIELAGDVLLLRARSKDRRQPHLPVNVFLSSLAAMRGGHAIGVILSGTASDGTEGLRAIKAENGITLVQDPRSAKFAGMPQSAVDAGIVDSCLPLPELAWELVRLSQHPYTSARKAGWPRHAHDGGAIERLFFLVRQTVGIDFSEYKPATFNRRLARRMALRRVENLGDYVKLIEETPEEAQALYEDALIHVTSFFREPEAFDALRKHALPRILEHKPKRAPLRLWVAGCSTGEEIYSLAICLLEFLGEDSREHPIQIFGSDISEQAIEKARAGFYPARALSDVSEERKARYFTQMDGGYRIAKSVRELCVFVRHDLARDPPFSRLDLVVCRNVLIYFTPPLQKRVLATFHYCLSNPGFLLLGRTESISGLNQFFSAVDKAHKLLARTEAPRKLPSMRGAELPQPQKQVSGRSSGEPVRPPLDRARQLDRFLLSRYAPPSVLVNERMEILQFRGHTGPYLEHPPGEPQFNILKMAREGLVAPLRLALAQAQKQGTLIRREGVQVGPSRSRQRCDIVVVPMTGLPESKERLYVVLFEEGTSAGKRGRKPTREAAARLESKKEAVRVTSLKLELDATKDYLQSLLEEHGRTNDALATANEELVSGNEELQSMNEELETAKEELQSTNEELTTVNDELHSRNQDLNHANSDLINLINTVDIPIVILDLERRIRRFTPKARSIMNVVPSDLGRPIGDITLNINVEGLDQQIAEVIELAMARESEIQDRTGRWHRMNIRPYKTTENKIDGAILSLVDIDALKHHLLQVEWARDYAAGIVEAVQVPLLVLDQSMCILSANKAFYQAFETSAAETEKRNLFELSGGTWNIPELRSSLEEMLVKNTRLKNLEVEREFLPLGNRKMSLSARSVHSRTGVPMLLLAIEDVTERAELLARAQQAKEEAEKANRAKDQFLATLSHELRTPLSTMLMHAQLLLRGGMNGDRVKRAAEAIERSTKLQVQLIDDLLDVSRIVAGKLRVQIQTVHLPAVIQAALESVSAQADRKSIRFETHLDESLAPVSGDPARLQQIVWNLLSNAIKFSAPGQAVSVVLESMNGHARLRVSDTGAGIEAGFLPHIFDRFMQEDSSSTRVFGGLGLGLAIVRHLVELHGGTVEAESAGKGKGAAFTVLLPLMPAFQEPAAAASLPTPEHGRAVLPSRSTGDSPWLKGLRILVVDDDPGTREATAELLSHAGAEVRAEVSAGSALALVEDFKPELLLSDIAMPGEDGYTFIRKVRALGPKRGGNVPAIALTALVSDADRQQVLAAGFQRHLAKPIDVDRLLEAVAEVRAHAAPPTPGNEPPAATWDEHPSRRTRE